MSAEISNNHIEQLKQLALQEALAAVKAGVDTATDTAKQNCPVDETDRAQEVHLIDTIRSEGPTRDGSLISGTVTAGDSTVGVDYAGYVEFGTVHPVGPGAGRPKTRGYTLKPQPYMTPGYEAGRIAAEERGVESFG